MPIKRRYCEDKARELLRSQGYLVIRSAGSRGPVDLVAVGEGRMLLIQVKRQGDSVARDRRRLQALEVPPGVRKQIWVALPRKPLGDGAFNVEEVV